ncbi:MAG: putative glycolipid-binding domain-containing protein [Gemmatimonadota bacterium]
MTEKPLKVVLLRSVLWRRRDEPAMQYSRFQEFAEGYIIDGRVLTVLSGQPAEIHYSVICDRAWQTQHAYAAIYQGTSTRQLLLRRDEQNQWWRGEERLPDLDGIVDVDLALTPSTNTLPIRRLNLAVGESKSTDAAWVRFPELTIERQHQRYTRGAAHRYRFEIDGGAFTAELEVDETGVVIRYEDLWERV